MNDLALVIPFYNESECVEKVLSDIASALSKNSISHDLIAVDNGSSDNTGELISLLGKTNSDIRLVKVEKNKGYGFGIISGIEGVSAKYVGFMDGDGQVKAEDVVKCFLALKEDPSIDLAKVYREERFDGPIRRFFSKGYNLFTWLCFGLRTKDINSCPKIWKYELHEKIKPLNSKDWFVDTEVMVKAKKNKAKIKEVPIVFSKREKGKSHVKPTVVWEFFKNTVKFRIRGKI